MVLAFKLVGVDGFAAETRQEVLDAFNRVTGRGGENSTPVDELPRVLGGLGIAIISTNNGVVTDKEARKLNVGGEVLAFVW